MTITKFRPTQSLLSDVFSPMGFDAIMNDFFAENKVLGSGTSNFRPAVDVVENEQSYELIASIPGVKKDDITLDVDGNQLTISGERTQTKRSDEDKQLFKEIRYGSFSRTFSLPEMVNKSKIEARFENGILNVLIPKTEKAKPKTIAIK